MSRHEKDIFNNYQPIKGDNRKKEKLYKQMLEHQNRTKVSLLLQKPIFQLVYVAIAILLFYISLPLFISNESTPGDETDNNKPYMKIMKRHDVYVGEGKTWKAAYTIDSIEAWINKEKKEYDSWNQSNGELTFLGTNPGEVKEIKYSLGNGSGTVSFEDFNGTYRLGGSASNGAVSKAEKMELIIEWDGKKEVITLEQNKELSSSKEMNRSKAVSEVTTFGKSEQPYSSGLPFQVAGKGSFQVGTSDWEPLMSNMDKIEPSLLLRNQSQNVLLMFKDLTNISKELTIRGVHESGETQTLYQTPSITNAAESFEAYNFVIPTTLSFKKPGIWELTAFEGDQEIGTVFLDVQMSTSEIESIPTWSEGTSVLRTYRFGINSLLEQQDVFATLYTGENNTQKVMWYFYTTEAREVFIQGLHESGNYSFSKLIDSIALGESENEHQAVTSMSFEKEGLWILSVYSNKEFLGKIALNVEHSE